MHKTPQEYESIIQDYEAILGIGENDPIKNAFIVYVKMLNQQVSYLKEFKIKDVITSADKESPEYKRAMEMVDGLPKMIPSNVGNKVMNFLDIERALQKNLKLLDKANNATSDSSLLKILKDLQIKSPEINKTSSLERSPIVKQIKQKVKGN